MKKAAYACAAFISLALTGWTSRSDRATRWHVPGDMREMAAACRNVPDLQTFMRNGYLAVECGNQAVLFGKKVPVAPAPHVPWAKPYARGRIKMLIICSVGNAPIDIAQLAQLTREMDVDVRWVLVADAAVTPRDTQDELYRTRYLPDQARQALRERYDMIVMSFGTETPNHGVAPAHPYFPDDVYQRILAEVQRGTGLLLVGQNRGGFWVNQTPLMNALPATMTGQSWKLDADAAELHAAPDSNVFATLAFDSHSYTQTYPFIIYGWQLRPDARVLAQSGERPVIMTRDQGKGRIVLLGWDGTLGPQRSWVGRTGFEHNTALLLRAITFAARKEPPVVLHVTASAVPAGQSAAVSVTSNARAELQSVLRDDDFHTLAQSVLHARAGDNSLRLPALPTGRYWLDLIARDDAGRSLGWASQAIEVRSPATLTVKTDRESYRVGDTVHVTATIAGGERDVTAGVEIRDAADRLLARSPASGDGATFQFAYPIVDARVAPHRATVTVLRGNAPVLQAATEFYVPQVGWNDYVNILWPRASGAVLNADLRDQAGLSGLMDGDGSDEGERVAARYGLQVLRMNDAVLDPGRVQTAPSKAFEASDDVLTKAIAAAQRYGALAWIFQDERHQTSDAGMPDAEGLRRFREYLRAQYPSLAALNASWDTRHESWDDIQPTLTDQVVHGVKNLAPWVDFRMYVADQAYQADKRHADMVRAALGPETYVGIDGFTTGVHTIPYGGLDLGRLVADRVFNFYCPYGDDLLVASMIKGPKAKYIGWSMPRQEYLGFPWRDAFRGHWGTLRFFGPTFYSDFGWVQPPGRWTEEGTRELRDGVGKLLMGSQRELSPVVILYSYASMMTAAGARYWGGAHGDEFSWRAANDSRSTFERMLLGSGVSPGYQTEAQVVAGGLAGKKLLIIPELMGMALSQAVCDAITAFVKEGGTVLADMAPAVSDEHGKLRSRGGLDELFGIAHDGLGYARQGPDYLAGLTQADPLVPQGEWYIDEWYEKTLRIADGTALGKHFGDEVPAFVTKQTGKGRTLLLNFLLAAELHADGTPEPNQYGLMRQVLRAAGVAPNARIETATGEPETHCEVNRMTDGVNEYVGVYAHRDPDASPSQVRVRFDDARETYDVRSGRYLGKRKDLPLPLRAEEAALFARLSYRVTRLSIRVQPKAKRGEPVAIDISVRATAAPGLQVVHLDVFAPTGERSHFYSRNLELMGGTGRTRLFFALNDPPGAWRIEAREVVSGATNQIRLAIE